MLQALREVGIARCSPSSTLCRISRLIWHILRVIIQQQMVQSRCDIVCKRRRPFTWTLWSHISWCTCPLAEQPSGSGLNIHLIHGLVLEEASEVAGLAQILELLINQRGIGESNVILCCGEGDEILCCGVADAVE